MLKNNFLIVTLNRLKKKENFEVVFHIFLNLEEKIFSSLKQEKKLHQSIV